MTFYSSGSLCLCPFLRLLPPKIVQPYVCSFLLHQSIKKDTGILDDFTSQLMDRKANKWEKRKALIQNKIKNNFIINDPIEVKSNVGIENLDIEKVNELFQTAIDYNDNATIMNLTKQCIKHDKIPSLNILLHVVSMHSRIGDKDSIIEVSALCKKVQPKILQDNSYFEHYIAEAIWIKGDITKSLRMFETVYKENPYLRCKIRSILKYLILDSFENRSEATFVNLTQFSDKLVQEYNDYFTLGCLWQACILSKWFADQQMALDFLDKYSQLCKIIANKIPMVVRISLRHHRTEIVYRLNEVLLKLKMESEVSQVLLALLDYWMRQGDFRQCKEIVLWCMENDIQISTISHNNKLLKLLIDDAKDIKTKFVSEIPKRVPTNYKF